MLDALRSEFPDARWCRRWVNTEHLVTVENCAVCVVGDDPWVRVGFEEERMYRVRDWAEVHRLFEREGWSKTKIADELGMSRNTVDRRGPLDSDESGELPTKWPPNGELHDLRFRW